MMTSLLNKAGVTFTDLLSEAHITLVITTEVINNADPRRGVIAQIASPAYSFPLLESLEAVAEDIEENTSGAPFPKASKVTPANDSDIPNLTVINSRGGDT